MVGHLLRYHPAIVRIHQMISAGELGSVTHVLCERLGSAPAGREETAWWALAPHDISVMRFLFDADPECIQASSMAASHHHPENAMASLLTFPGGRLGVVRVADGSPSKVRRITVVGERRSVTFTDHQGGAALLHYDTPLTLNSLASRAEPTHHETVDATEPLQLQGQHFVDCLHAKQPFASDALEGLAVVRVLEAGSRALRLAHSVPLALAAAPPINAWSPRPAAVEELA
jgi:UDP-2-acetamido-3-amino-2,3-dideoxy-glucuronate N-acetyltransferase